MEVAEAHTANADAAAAPAADAALPRGGARARLHRARRAAAVHTDIAGSRLRVRPSESALTVLPSVQCAERSTIQHHLLSFDFRAFGDSVDVRDISFPEKKDWADMTVAQTGCISIHL